MIAAVWNLYGNFLDLAINKHFFNINHILCYNERFKQKMHFIRKYICACYLKDIDIVTILDVKTRVIFLIDKHQCTLKYKTRRGRPC